MKHNSQSKKIVLDFDEKIINWDIKFYLAYSKWLIGKKNHFYGNTYFLTSSSEYPQNSYRIKSFIMNYYMYDELEETLLIFNELKKIFKRKSIGSVIKYLEFYLKNNFYLSLYEIDDSFNDFLKNNKHRTNEIKKNNNFKKYRIVDFIKI